jgi:hypothetical protein
MPPAIATEWLRAHLATEEVFMANQGRCGHTTMDTLPANHQDVSEIERAATHLEDAHPGRMVFSIMLGTNDSAEMGPLGAPVAPQEYHRNLTTMIDQWRRPPVLLKPGQRLLLHRGPCCEAR